MFDPANAGTSKKIFHQIEKPSSGGQKSLKRSLTWVKSARR
jgi:hypothetical protein